MVRVRIKTAVSSVLARTGAARMVSSRLGCGPHPLVLGYHRVVEDFTRECGHSIPAMLTSQKMLRSQMEWLGRRFRFVTLEEAGDCWMRGSRGAKPPAAITFDDGYRDVYLNAFPLLRQMGIPAAVFVVTGLADTETPQIHDLLYLHLAKAFAKLPAPGADLARLLQRANLPLPIATLARCKHPFEATGFLLGRFSQAEIERVMETLADALGEVGQDMEGLRPLNWSMIAEMHAAGFTIGSHTHSHALLTNETGSKVSEELESSRTRLREKLNAPIRHLAYPDGRFDSSVVKAAVAAGYSFGYTTCRHRDPTHPSLTIPRKILWENSCVDASGNFSADVMECQIARLFEFAAPCALEHRATVSATGTSQVEAYGSLEHS